MSDVCEVVVTAPDPEWLVRFARRLIDDRLCAGSHHVSPIRSLYRWEGEVHDRSEARVALHTRVDLVPQIIDRADREHPYDVPCVIALPIAGGNPAYLQWIRDTTRDHEVSPVSPVSPTHP